MLANYACITASIAKRCSGKDSAQAAVAELPLELQMGRWTWKMKMHVCLCLCLCVCGNADNKAANVPDAQVCVEVCVAVCVCGNRSALIHI